MAAHSLATEYEGLKRIVEYIERLTPQCPVGFRSHENKIRFLCSAVLGYEWALTPIRRIVTHGYKFHGFGTALHESLNLSEELKSRRSSSVLTGIDGMEEEDAAESFFQRNERHPRDVRQHNAHNRHSSARGRFTRHRKGNSSRSFDEARRRNEYFKCGSGWKPGHRCEAGAITENARNRLRQGDSHVHIVSDLLLGLEDEVRAADEIGAGMMEGEGQHGDVFLAEDSLHQLDQALAFSDDSRQRHPYFQKPPMQSSSLTCCPRQRMVTRI